MAEDAPDATIPVIPTIGSRDGTLAKDCKMVNALPERGELGMAAVKRPGMSLLVQNPAYAAQGQFNLSGAGYAIVNDRAYPHSGGASFAIPTVVTAGLIFQHLDDYATGKTLIKSAKGLWVVTAGVATKVTDADFPANSLPGIAELDGTFYIMASDGTVQGSAIQDPTSWDALNFIGPNSSLGAGVAVHRHLNYIVGFYDRGTQLFYDAQNPTGSPLSPVENASWLTGCASAGSITELGDELFFMSKAGPKGRSITRMAGLQPIIISDPYVDRILNLDSLTGVRSFGLRIAGHSLYILTLPSSDVTLVYDTVYQHWSVWTSDIGGTEHAFRGCNYLNSNNLDCLQDISTGAVYSMQAGVWQDNTSPIHTLIRTPPKDWRTLHRKFLPAMYLRADTAATTVEVRWSDDDYATFSTTRSIDLSTDKKMLLRCGSSRRRSWDLKHTGNTPLRLYGIEVEVAGGVG